MTILHLQYLCRLNRDPQPTFLGLEMRVYSSSLGKTFTVFL
ncbi:hypothetical protein [Chlamydia abortus]|nr:hypothetical protein [Chlamydia abortus]